MTLGVCLLACLLVAWGTSVAQTQGSGRTPSLLPGKRLAEHDSLYARELHERRIFLVRQGEVVSTNATEHEITLQTRHPDSTHGQFRHARLTNQGTLMVARMDSNKVVEYGYDGKELWSFPAAVPWGVTPLPNGNVLITDR